MGGAVHIPRALVALAARGPSWASWLERLPRLVSELLEEWDLTVDGPSMHGECAIVVPVVTAEGVAGVLKTGWPHEESALEHLALRSWGGRGAARLLRADPRRSALLIERLGAVDLSALDIGDACEVISGLYARLHIKASPQFRRVSALCDSWALRLDSLPGNAGLPRRYVERAAGLARELAADPATDGTLIHSDLHFYNVLGRYGVLGDPREPWLAIDPKPLSGEPAYEIAPLLWNRWEEMVATGNVRRAIRHRFHTVVDAAGLDEERAKAWVVVRLVVNAMEELEEPVKITPEAKSWITDCVTVVKAMED